VRGRDPQRRPAEAERARARRSEAEHAALLSHRGAERDLHVGAD
jgi:hypothetical protein